MEYPRIQSLPESMYELNSRAPMIRKKHATTRAIHNQTTVEVRSFVEVLTDRL